MPMTMPGMKPATKDVPEKLDCGFTTTGASVVMGAAGALVVGEEGVGVGVAEGG